MTLELKHLAPYLPYGLGLKFYEKQIEMYNGNILSVLKFVNLNIEDANKHYFPILRPLSDLTKENYQEIANVLDEDYRGNLIRSHIEFHLEKLACSYWIMQELFKRHIDVFGLIEKGLAIDKNKF